MNYGRQTVTEYFVNGFKESKEEFFKDLKNDAIAYVKVHGLLNGKDADQLYNEEVESIEEWGSTKEGLLNLFEVRDREV